MSMQTTKMQSRPFYLSKKTLQTIKKGKEAVVKGDQDRVIIITGREGSGKSTLARQIAYEFDPTFCINDITFNATDFAERIRNCDKYKAIVFDEAFNGLSSKGALSKENKQLVRLLQECRQRNLFIIVVLPSIFILEKYVAVFRSHYLINTQTYKKDFRKRFYKIYNYYNKKVLYIYGKKFMSYARPKINMMHRFYAKFPPGIDREEYDRKKLRAFKDEDKKKEDPEEKWRRLFAILAFWIQTHKKVSYNKISSLVSDENVSVDTSYIGKIAREHGKKDKE